MGFRFGILVCSLEFRSGFSAGLGFGVYLGI